MLQKHTYFILQVRTAQRENNIYMTKMQTQSALNLYNVSLSSCNMCFTYSLLDRHKSIHGEAIENSVVEPLLIHYGQRPVSVGCIILYCS